MKIYLLLGTLFRAVYKSRNSKEKKRSTVKENMGNTFHRERNGTLKLKCYPNLMTSQSKIHNQNHFKSRIFDLKM